MSINEFNNLDCEQQVSEVWKNGHIVASRMEGHYKYLLLHLYSFYVELRYDTRLNSLDFETYCVSSERLDNYLETINVEYLFSEADLE
jgi:hypothetical protein